VDYSVNNTHYILNLDQFPAATDLHSMYFNHRKPLMTDHRKLYIFATYIFYIIIPCKAFMNIPLAHSCLDKCVFYAGLTSFIQFS